MPLDLFCKIDTVDAPEMNDACNPLDVMIDAAVLIAHSWNGQPLSREHEGPARVIVPQRYAWKGARWIREILFLDRDLLGFWELRGYCNSADPFKEERFA